MLELKKKLIMFIFYDISCIVWYLKRQQIIAYGYLLKTYEFQSEDNYPLGIKLIIHRNKTIGKPVIFFIWNVRFINIIQMSHRHNQSIGELNLVNTYLCGLLHT